jgi:hypothetical protein
MPWNTFLVFEQSDGWAIGNDGEILASSLSKQTAVDAAVSHAEQTLSRAANGDDVHVIVQSDGVPVEVWHRIKL